MALWPFKPSTLLDADTVQWHVDIACWFLRNHGETCPRKPARLILPGRGFYRLTEADGRPLVEQIFEQTKAFAGLAEWHVDVVAQERPSLAPDVDVVEAANDLGGRRTLPPSIGYLPEWQDDPFRLITWFARPGPDAGRCK